MKNNQGAIDIMEAEIERLEAKTKTLQPQHILVIEDKIRLEQTAKLLGLVRML